MNTINILACFGEANIAVETGRGLIACGCIQVSTRPKTEVKYHEALVFFENLESEEDARSLKLIVNVRYGTLLFNNKQRTI